MIKQQVNTKHVAQISFVSAMTITQDIKKIESEYKFILSYTKKQYYITNITYKKRLTIFNNLHNLEVEKMINFSTANLQLLFKENLDNQVINLCFNLKYKLNNQVLGKINWISYFVIITYKIEINPSDSDILELFEK